MASHLHLDFRSTLVLPIVLAVAWPILARQTADSPLEKVRQRYTKYEYRIPMRDGVRLFTAVYVPKDISRTYPVLITRTPYSVGPYGADAYDTTLGPSKEFQDEGFIFVYQDARGRYMSEGEFQQVRPHVPDKRLPTDVDESSDTHDSIDWLLKHVPNHNGRVGMVGVSQPGFHVAASLMKAHPALKAASPQAPTADYYMGDDVYHNGAFMLAANFSFYSSFRPRGADPSRPKPSVPFDYGTADGYEFFLALPPLSEVNARLFEGKSPYFQEIVDHPNYDQFWQVRSVWKHATNVVPAVLNVGGWFDAEDPMGPLYMYRSIQKNSPSTDNRLVMGPWSHGGWSFGDGSRLGNLAFAVKTGEYFRKEIQFPWFMHHLKGVPLPAGFAKTFMFATGVNEFRRLPAWPPADVTHKALFLGEDGALQDHAPAAEGFDEYVSDPQKPVPYVGYVARGMNSDYMTEDQRFASTRPDVLVYRGGVLEEDLTVAGPVKVDLTVSTSGTDSDFVVKLIDVYPGDYPQPDPPKDDKGRVMPVPSNTVRLGGYQQLVRGEPFRAKFRNSFETPTPMTPDEPVTIAFELPDVYHVFRRGHRVMVHVQSSWFPLIDRNPQTFVDIPKAPRSAYRKATERVYRGGVRGSSIILPVRP